MNLSFFFNLKKWQVGVHTTHTSFCNRFNFYFIAYSVCVSSVCLNFSKSPSFHYVGRSSLTSFVLVVLDCLQVPRYPRCEIFQQRALLHNTGGDLPGVPVYLQPHNQTPRRPLLPPTTGNRPVARHELLCACHQGKDCIRKGCIVLAKALACPCHQIYGDLLLL